MEQNLHKGSTWLWAAATGWGLFILPFVIALTTFGLEPYRLGSDSAMRLVEVRDLLAGRGWFDHMQPRLGLGEGTWMHWSRLVDAPIAGLILLFSSFLSYDQAETLALTVWPLLLALIPIAAIAFAAFKLSGIRGAFAGAIIIAQMMTHVGVFGPSTLDHHNVQIALLVLIVCFSAVGLSRPIFAGLSGAAVACTIAVGIETLLYVIALSASLALLWVFKGKDFARQVTHYFLGLAITMSALFIATAPSEAYIGGYCDAFSIDQAAPIVIGSLGLVIIMRFLTLSPIAVRAIALSGLGVAVLAGAYVLVPGCLTNPVDQIDPMLMELWFDRITETQPLLSVLGVIPSHLVPLILIWALGFVSALSLMVIGHHRSGWGIIAFMLAVVMGMTFWQIRGALFIGPLAILPITGLIAHLYRRSHDGGPQILGIAAILLFVASIPQLWSTAILQLDSVRARLEENPNLYVSNLGECYSAREMQVLAELPPGLVAAGSNLGTPILAYTPHSVISAPYHRNQEGMLAELKIDYATDAEAEERLRALGIDYVVNCYENQEFSKRDGSLPGFSFRLRKGIYPDFLIPVESPLDDPIITVYRLAPKAE